jgi:hypothetical protein
MKTIFGFLLLIAFTNSGQCQTEKTITRIELSKITRGYEEYVRLTPDSVNVLVSSSIDPTANVYYGKTIEESEWASLVDAISASKLNDIPSLPSPTMNRATDAAKHATITIETNDGKSYEHGYDDENPNDALKPLLSKIREVSGRKD